MICDSCSQFTADGLELSLDICSRGAELAVQSQQRRWDDASRHPQLQPALSSAGTDEWVLSWRLNEASDSSGDRRAVGSRFQVLGPYAAKLRWPVDVRVPGTREGPRDGRKKL